MPCSSITRCTIQNPMEMDRLGIWIGPTVRCIKYNYSHGNTGGALLICKEESNYGMFRYNISQNDTYFFDHTYTGGSTAVIHNNTFYAGPDTQGVDRYSSTNTEPKILLANNIFYNGESTNRKPVWQDGSLNYYNNLYYGYDAIPNDNRAVSGDPYCRAPGTEMQLAQYRITLITRQWHRDMNCKRVHRL